MGPSPTVQPPDEANPASPSISVLDLPVPPEKNSPPLPIGGDSAGADDIRLLPRLAQKIAKMEITNPEVLRAYKGKGREWLGVREERGGHLHAGHSITPHDGRHWIA
eukprot:Skav206631  [mRNA]  locus=scaffold2313:109720:111200:- [translate_table: standard]